MALRSSYRVAEGLQQLDEVLQLEPANAIALFQRARFLEDLLRLDEALKSYDDAVRAKPGYAAALAAKAFLLMGLRRLREAQVSIDAALRAKPQYAKACYLYGELLLMQGEYQKGWELFEARLDAGTHRPHPASEKMPRWDGQPIAGLRLLIHEEFGAGDVLMMARYFRALEHLGAQLVLVVRAGLVRLLQASFPKAVVVGKSAPVPTAHFHCPMMSLPFALRHWVQSPPSDLPYLKFDTGAAGRWLTELGPANKPRVGIFWASTASREIDRSPLRNRSASLGSLAPLLRLPLEFHSLQQDVSQHAETMGIRQHGQRLTDFAETAALATAMDAVVSIDTSVAHLAGALGLPLRVVLPYAVDYRWQQSARHTRWYRQAKLFQQDAPGDWASAMNAVSDSLAIEFGIGSNL
jgi:hypothetical protein